MFYGMLVNIKDNLQMTAYIMHRLLYTLRSDEFQTRWSAVKREIKATGTYELTHEELEYGVQLCWRNEPRCSARIQWKNLVSADIYITLPIIQNHGSKLI